MYKTNVNHKIRSFLNVKNLVVGVLLTFIVGGFGLLNELSAAGDLTKQEPIEVKLQLGNEKGELKFFPEKLEFETGKLYKMVITNPSKEKHYFSSDAFSRAVYTRKVQVVGSGGKTLAEIKGSVREIEVYPGAHAEWWFVPVQAIQIGDMKCTIKGHAEGGMVGHIIIK